MDEESVGLEERLRDSLSPFSWDDLDEVVDIVVAMQGLDVRDLFQLVCILLTDILLNVPELAQSTVAQYLIARAGDAWDAAMYGVDVEFGGSQDPGEA